MRTHTQISNHCHTADEYNDAWIAAGNPEVSDCAGVVWFIAHRSLDVEVIFFAPSPQTLANTIESSNQ